MKNKILINVYVSKLNENYELFVSINETIDKNLQLIVKIVAEYSDSEFSDSDEFCLVDPITCNVYNNNLILRDTNIRNSSLILLV